MPKLSVILPVYNVENYLSDCLESVLNQSYGDIEVIIIDDGSTDNSLMICKDYCQKDSRIRLYTQENQGISVTRNRGLDLARGEFLTFMDSDDTIDSDMYDSLMSKFSDSDIDVVISGHRVVQLNGETYENKYGEFTLSGVDATRMILDDSVLPSFLWDKIYRADLWEGIRFPVGRIYEDLATVYKILDKSKKVKIIDGVYYNYYRRPRSICLNPGEMNQKKRLYDLFLAFYDRYEFAHTQIKYSSMVPLCAEACIEHMLLLLHSAVLYKWDDILYQYADLRKKSITLARNSNAKLSFKRKLEVNMLICSAGLHRLLLKCWYINN